MIIQALSTDQQVVYDIVQNTIAGIYPHYYPLGAVHFFQNHHSQERIAQDILEGNVYLLYQNCAPVATVTINGNEINRLFVLPKYQGSGYGGQLMEFAEQIISEQYEEVLLSSSFSAQQMYLRMGYSLDRFEKIACEGGDWLCYYLMRKKL